MNGSDHYFITGIGTEVGKTITSAILTEKFKVNYWKPIQAGDLDFTDSMKVKSLIENRFSIIFPEQVLLKNPFSPHKAADLEDYKIILKNFIIPKSTKPIICEGAGGLMAPLNFSETILDLISYLGFRIILVSKHYLGSINHTLLTLSKIKEVGLNLKGIIFNGDEDSYSEKFIIENSGATFLGRIPFLVELNPLEIKKAGENLQFAI